MVPVTLNLGSDLHHARGGGRVLQAENCANGLRKKKSILFSPSLFCHENILEPVMVVRWTWHPPGLICNPWTWPHTLRAAGREEVDGAERNSNGYGACLLQSWICLQEKGAWSMKLGCFQRPERLLIPSRISFLDFSGPFKFMIIKYW